MRRAGEEGSVERGSQALEVIEIGVGLAGSADETGAAVIATGTK